MKYEESKKVEQHITSEHWSGEACGFDFWIYRQSDRGVRIGAQPIDYRNSGKIPLFEFSPKHVDDLERFADEMPKVFRVIAQEMRKAGLIDLRSRGDKWDDARKQWEAAVRKANADGKPAPPYPTFDKVEPK